MELLFVLIVEKIIKENMNKLISFLGLILVLLATHLYIYGKGLTDGKIKYQHSKNMQLTLDSAYRYGLFDGRIVGYISGYDQGAADCKKEFLKMPRKAKAKWCK